MKRFTDTEKWRDEWFFELPMIYKLAWVYVLDRCDSVGHWKQSLRLASMEIGEPVDWGEFRELCGDRIATTDSGYWFVTGFVGFQYGELKDTVRPHQSYIRQLKAKGIDTLLKGHERGFKTPKDKDKEKDKEKDKDKDKEKEKASDQFDRYLAAWNSITAGKLAGIRKIDEARRIRLKAREKADPDFYETWQLAVRNMITDPFYIGESDRGTWKADFDYLLKTGNDKVDKVLKFAEAGVTTLKPNGRAVVPAEQRRGGRVN